MTLYDAIIIGAGQSGPFLAAALAGDGEKVALVEGYKIGGSCVNYGCIPTKTIIASARAAHLARRGDEFGFSIGGAVTVDLAKVMARKDKRVGEAQGGMENWLRNMDNLTVYDGYAAFDGKEGANYRIRIGETLITAPRVFINTGTRNVVPPIPGLDAVDYLDNEGILNLRTLPQHLLILGGGYIGLEMGQAFRRFGSQVTIIEAAPTLIAREDEDVALAVQEILEAEGIRVLTGHKATRVEQGDDGTITMTVETGDGRQHTLSGSHLLVAVGRRPNSDRLNLESVGVEVDKRGYIQTDDMLQTSAEGVWAMGDVNGRGAFTHTSYHDYEIVRDNLRGGQRKVSERNMVYAMYIDPPLGRVGLSEREARESGRPTLIAKKPMSHMGRALEQGETQGFIKLLVDAETERFVGAAVLGFHGDDVIQVISYFMATGASYKVMQRALPIHPTISEFLPTILGELQPLA